MSDQSSPPPGEEFPQDAPNHGSFSELLGDIKELRVRLDAGLIKTVVSNGVAEGHAFQGEWEAPHSPPFKTRYYTESDIGYLTIQQQPYQHPYFSGRIDSPRLTLHLTGQVPIHFKLNAGVGTTTLDLSALTVNDLRIEGGVGRIDLTLPRKGTPDIHIEGGVGAINVHRPDGESELLPRCIRVHAGVGKMSVDLPSTGNYPATIEAGVGRLSVNVPEGLAAQIKHRGSSFLSRMNIQRKGLTFIGNDYWQTSNYSPEAAHRANITVEAGVGNVEIK